MNRVQTNSQIESLWTELPPEAIHSTFTLLDKESWESVSQVCTIWDIWMKDVKWGEVKRDPMIRAYVTYLTDLTNCPMMESFPLQKQLLQTITNKLLNLNTIEPPESLAAILTYNMQIEKDIATTLLQMTNTSTDAENLLATLIERQFGIDKNEKACRTICKNVHSLVLLRLLSKIPHLRPEHNALVNAISQAFADGHGKEVFFHVLPLARSDRKIKDAFKQQRRSWPEVLVEPLVRRGLFNRLFSLIEQPLPLLTPTLIKKSFKTCIEEGCVSTANRVFRDFVPRCQDSFSPKKLEKLAKRLSLAYLEKGNLEEAFSLIKEYHFHLDPQFMLEAVERLAIGGNWDEARVLVSVHEKSDLLPYQKITDSSLATICHEYVIQGDLETVEPFIRSICNEMQGMGERILGGLLFLLGDRYIKNNQKEKALPLLTESGAISAKIGTEIFMGFCGNLLFLEQAHLAIALMEQNNLLYTPLTTRECEKSLSAFSKQFAKMNKEIMKRDGTLFIEEGYPALTERLIHLLEWMETTYYKNHYSFSGTLFAPEKKMLLDSLNPPAPTSSSSSSDTY